MVVVTGSSFNTTEVPSATPPRLRAASDGQELSSILQSSPRSLPIEIPSPLGSPVSRFRARSGSYTTGDFAHAFQGDASAVSIPADHVERLRLAEAELRSLWERVRDWNSMGLSSGSYDVVPEELSSRFERISLLVASNSTLCRDVSEIEESIRFALEPPLSSRDIRRGMSPGINMHFEYLIREIRRAMEPPMTSTHAPPSSNPGELSSDEDDDSANASSSEDDGLHFPLDD